MGLLADEDTGTLRVVVCNSSTMATAYWPNAIPKHSGWEEGGNNPNSSVGGSHAIVTEGPEAFGLISRSRSSFSAACDRVKSMMVVATDSASAATSGDMRMDEDGSGGSGSVTVECVAILGCEGGEVWQASCSSSHISLACFNRTQALAAAKAAQDTADVANANSHSTGPALTRGTATTRAPAVVSLLALPGSHGGGVEEGRGGQDGSSSGGGLGFHAAIE